VACARCSSAASVAAPRPGVELRRPLCHLAAPAGERKTLEPKRRAIKHLRTPKRRPQPNGKVERFPPDDGQRVGLRPPLPLLRGGMASQASGARGDTLHPEWRERRLHLLLVRSSRGGMRSQVHGKGRGGLSPAEGIEKTPTCAGVFCSACKPDSSSGSPQNRMIWLNHAVPVSSVVPFKGVKGCPRDAPMHGRRLLGQQ
jgi:hypothetical protein